MQNLQVFKITGQCNFDGEEENAPCTCFPDLTTDCIIDNCEFLSLFDVEIDEEYFEEE